jgi:hypothetical protein
VSNFDNNKIFILELQVGQNTDLLNTVLNRYPQATALSNGKVLLKVSEYQIKSEIQRLQRLRTKILDVYPIDDEKYQKIITEETIIFSPPQTQPAREVAPPENFPQEIPSPVEVLPENNLSSMPSNTEENVISPDTPWWVEIFTEYPRCLYYFGPFDTEEEASYYQSGYVEDLEGEGAKEIIITIKQCSPQILTQEL